MNPRIELERRTKRLREATDTLQAACKGPLPDGVWDRLWAAYVAASNRAMRPVT